MKKMENKLLWPFMIGINWTFLCAHIKTKSVADCSMSVACLMCPYNKICKEMSKDFSKAKCNEFRPWQ